MNIFFRIEDPLYLNLSILEISDNTNWLLLIGASLLAILFKSHIPSVLEHFECDTSLNFRFTTWKMFKIFPWILITIYFIQHFMIWTFWIIWSKVTFHRIFHTNNFLWTNIVLVIHIFNLQCQFFSSFKLSTIFCGFSECIIISKLQNCKSWILTIKIW